MSFGLSPTEWGARVDYDSWTDRIVEKDKIFVHYNGGTPVAQGGVDVETARIRSAENHHLDVRGWRGIAYGWAIGSTTGTVFRLRGWNLYGAHLGDMDDDGVLENYEGIPVYFTVGGDQNISPAARQSFADLRTYLEREVGQPLPVYGHRDTQSTSCPGDVLYAWARGLPPLEDDMAFTPEEETFLKGLYAEIAGSGGNERSLRYSLDFYRGLAAGLNIGGDHPDLIASAVLDDTVPGHSHTVSVTLNN